MTRPRPWTPDDLRKLRMWWNANVGVPAMAGSLGRSQAAVIAMVARLREAGEPLALRNPMLANRKVA